MASVITVSFALIFSNTLESNDSDLINVLMSS